MDRIRSLRAQLPTLGADSFLVTNEINVRYLTGFTGDSSYLWVTPDDAVILSDGRYTAQLAMECAGISAAIRSPETKMVEHVAAMVGDGAAPVAIEADDWTLESFDNLTPLIQRPWVRTCGVVAAQRMIKDSSEIEITRRAIQIAEDAFVAVGFQPGHPAPVAEMGTEIELAFALEAEMRKRGASGTSFDPIVAVDENGALPHYRPSDRPLAGCQTLLIDWGAKYQGYASDLTRTLHRDPVSDEFRRAYQACLAAKEAAIAAIAPGVVAADVDAAARESLISAGFGDAFKHSLGHGIGLQIHEGPRMGGNVETPLAAGMIVTVEPGIYLDGKFGIRIEDDILITPTGSELLSTQLSTGLDENGLIG